MTAVTVCGNEAERLRIIAAQLETAIHQFEAPETRRLMGAGAARAVADFLRTLQATATGEAYAQVVPDPTGEFDPRIPPKRVGLTTPRLRRVK